MKDRGGAEDIAPVGAASAATRLFASSIAAEAAPTGHVDHRAGSKRLQFRAVRIHTQEGLFALGTVARLPSLVIVKNRFRNVPEMPRILGPWAVSGPATSYPETFFFAPKGWKPAPEVARLTPAAYRPAGGAR